MTKHYGAAPQDWDHFAFALDLIDDLLPVVSDLGIPISPDSTLKGLGKTPSLVSRAGAVGIAGWTQKHTSLADMDRWRDDGRLGICIQTRTVRAFDIDIEDPDLAQQVADFIIAQAGKLPCRRRQNSPKRLFVFELAGELPKRVIKMQTGMVEMLGTGQQFIACGTHTSGVRYDWADGLPDSIPKITKDQFETIWSGLATKFGVSQSEASTPTKAKVLAEAAVNDPVAKHLLDEGWVKQTTKEGALHIRCPFEDGHSTDSADSATTYWPAHTGGYVTGHFHCLHASCAHRTDDDFKAAAGMAVVDPFEGFYPLGDEPADGTIPADGTTPAEESQPPKKKRFQVVPAHEFSAGKPPGWIIKGVLPRAPLVVMYGDSGSGKSFLALDLSGAIARGVDWRNRHVQKGKVAYVCAEGAGGMRARLIAYANQHSLNLRDLDIGIIPDAPNFMQVQDVKDLILSIQAFGKVSVIVVDTFAQVMAGANENAGEDVGKALDHCRQLHKYTGALVVLIHHSGKDSSKGARGWSGLRAAADAEIEIVRCDDDRVATVTKMKDGPDGAEFGFKLTPLILGLDDDGDDITSCIVEEASTQRAAVAPKNKAGVLERLALKCLDNGVELGSVGVPYDELLNTMVSQMAPPGEGKRDSRRTAASKAVTELVDAGSLVVVNGFVQRPAEEG
jgi:hypothetical protein